MGKVLYTAEAHVTGGRVAGHGRTSDGALEVDLRTPPEMGGEGGGTNPEQLFAVGYAACFESAMAAVARRRKLEVCPYSNATRGNIDVTLSANGAPVDA
jgi:Ohr subfamily peroxiredoxin